MKKEASLASAREIARTIASEAIASIDVRNGVFEALPRLPPTRARVTAIAIGKAAPVMMRAALDRWGERIARAIVVTTDATDAASLAATKVEILRAGHPLPDARSVLAADAILAAVAGASSPDVTLCLVSGGASALVCAPVEGLSLGDQRAVVDAMLASGAPIEEVNLVRRHLSRIKGGGLARASLPGRTLSIIASDVLVSTPEGVVDGPAHDVGSGPGVPDPTSIDEAHAALARWAPSFASFGAAMTEHARWKLDPQAEEARRTRAKIAVGPSDLATAAAHSAAARGLHARVLAPSLGSVDALADEYARLSNEIGEGEAWVRVAEPSVVLPAVRGKGGRAGRLALLAASNLALGVALACVASDGVDGSSDAAGAVVSRDLFSTAAARDSLDRFDDALFLASHGASVVTGPTGKNLLDLHVLVRLG